MTGLRRSFTAEFKQEAASLVQTLTPEQQKILELEAPLTCSSAKRAY